MDRQPVDPALPVVWRDDTALVCDKAAGLLVHNAAFAGPRERTVTDVLRERHGADLSPVHRLDRGTSGVLLFARREHVRAWQEALTDARTDKRYLALARGYVREAVHVDHPIEDEGGVKREAQSDVRPLCSVADPGCTLVEVRVFTGRTHQVRRHLKHLSHPVYGDANYGHGPLNRDFRARFGLARLALHAWRVAITHPVTCAGLVWRAEPPEDLMAPWRAIFGDEALRDALRDARRDAP